MNTQKKTLEVFGELLISEVRDTVIRQLDLIIDNKTKANSAIKLHPLLDSFSKENIVILKKFIQKAVDSTLHYTLFAFEQNNEEFDIIADPESDNPVSLTKLSDGLCGELYSEDGWIKKYSKYPSSYD